MFQKASFPKFNLTIIQKNTLQCILFTSWSNWDSKQYHKRSNGRQDSLRKGRYTETLCLYEKKVVSICKLATCTGKPGKDQASVDQY